MSVAPPVTFDAEAARAHVAEIASDAATPVCVRLIHDKDRSADAIKLYGPIDKLAPEIAKYQAQGYGAFVVVSKGGDRNADINEIRACFVDGDDIPLPKTWHLKPDFLVVRDRKHWHAYWRVDDCPVDRFCNLQKRLAALYETDPAVCNESRVMRLAGSLHQKGNPVLVTLRNVAVDENGLPPSHTFQEITAALPELAMPAPAHGAGTSPVDPAVLRGALSFLNPFVEYHQWRDIVAGIGSADCADAREIAHDWSAGKLDARNQFADPGHKYDGPSAVECVLDSMPPKVGGVTVASVFAAAKAAGWTGNPYARSSAETFKDIQMPADDPKEPAEQTRKQDKFRVLLPNVFRSLPAPSYILGHLLPARAVILTYGPYGSFKTFIALEWAFQIATGKATGFGAVTQGAVAYCAGEAPLGVARKRFPAWMQERGIGDTDHVPFALVPAVPLVSTTADVDALIEALSATKLRFSLIVIDTAARALGGLDENSAKDVGYLLVAVERLRDEFDCSVLLIHHSGKDESRGARGSSALIAGVDAAFETKADTDALAVTLRCEKMKDADPPQPLRLQGKRVLGFDSLVFDPIGEADYAALTRTNTSAHTLDVAAALKALNAVNGTAVTTQVLAFEMAGKGAPPDVVESKRRALQRGAKDRLRCYVKQLGEGSGHRTLWTMPHVDDSGRVE